MTYVLERVDSGTAAVPAVGLVDPRSRIIAVALFALLVVALSDLLALTLALAFAVAALIHARLPAAKTLRMVIMMDSFMIFLILSLPFTMPGDTAFVVLGLPGSWQGFNQAIQIGLRANAIVLALFVLVGTIGPVMLGHALARLRIPALFVHLLLFTVRYIEVLHDEYRRLRVAMRTRGFKPRTNVHTARTLGYLIGMLLIRALDRSERILKAMKCRGFHGEFPIMDDLQVAPRREYAFAGVMAAVVASLIVLEGFHVATF